jgi:protein-L-isoaspartate(D-aspartate) O-methyltransferase
VVLEVGTGSGYQAAILSGLVAEVYSIEIIPELAASANEVLQRLGYNNVHVRAGDGYLGWPDHAPFDGIIVTAAADEVPPPLVEQLKPGARLVIPIASPGGSQDLLVIEKLPDGSTTSRSVLPVRFVPLTGEH